MQQTREDDTKDEAPDSPFPLGAEPRRIGRYVVLDTLGQGGMGTVLRAHDRELDRQVAIKVLLPELDHRYTQRLRREAQALAKLSHPNVVQVYEVGEVEGRTFVVMELVKGQTLKQWMQQEPRPGWRACVELLVQLGAGLAAAHQRGLVHRDFKPSNAIIDEEGRPRVLDFGLARQAEPQQEPPRPAARAFIDEPVALEESLTKTGAVLGTPAYMPPEQMNGGEADARSDQFSFCVSLYEAVCGERPYEGSSMMALMMSMRGRKIRPSSKAGKMPPALRKVLLRGLSIEPQERWPSMDALLQPLRALVAPRRWRFVGLGLGVLAIGVAVGAERYAAWAHRCTGARDELRGIWDDARRDEVRAAILATKMSYAADTWSRVETGLDEYASAWASAHTEVCEATTVRGEHSPEVMDLRMRCLYERRVALRETVDVLARADATRVEKAVTLVTELPRLSPCDDVEALARALPLPEDADEAREVEELRERLERARALEEGGAYDDALSVAEVVTQRAEVLGYQPLLVEALYRRGRIDERLARYPRAEEDLERAYVLGIEVGHEEVATDAARELVAVVGYDEARHEAGLLWGKTALARARSPRGHRRGEAAALVVIGNVLLEQDRLTEALDHYEQARAMREEELGPTHPDVARTLGNIGLVLLEQGKLDEALDHHRRALELLEVVLGPRHPGVARALANIGHVRLQQGELDDALAHFRRASSIEVGALGPEHPSVAYSMIAVGGVHHARGELDEALASYRRAQEIEERALGPRHPDLADLLGNIGNVLLEQGNVDAALEHFQRALEIVQGVQGPRHTRVGSLLNNIGNAMVALGRLDEALDQYRRASSIFEESLGPEHPDLAGTLGNIGGVLQQQGKLEEAMQHYLRALAIRERTPNQPQVAVLLVDVGSVLLEQGQPDAARERFHRALSVLERTLGPRNPMLVHPLMGLAEVALAQHDDATARVYAEQAVAACEPGPPKWLAEARFVLARASWAEPAERARARALAEQAREAHRALGPDSGDALAEVDAWLAEHVLR